MIIRLGYVAIALNLKNVTSSSTVTFATYNKLKSEIGEDFSLFTSEQVDEILSDLQKSDFIVKDIKKGQKNDKDF